MKFPANQFTAVILADGKNTRFGAEKSLLLIDEQPLLTKNIKFLSKLFESIMLVTSKPILTRQYALSPSVEDIFKNCGPLGGIHAALSVLPSKYAFIFACDMPYLSHDVIIKQKNKLIEGDYDVFVPSHSEGIEPLHAIYSKSCLPVITKQLEHKICSIRSFYNQVKTGFYEVSKDEADSFFNINTMHDYRQTQQMKRSQ